MRLSSLGSGSRGNATVIDIAGRLIMVDCGFGLKDTGLRLEKIGYEPNDIEAILVTHEHADHIAGVEALAARFDIPVYMTAGTFHAWKSRGRVTPTLIRADEKFDIGELEILPVPVPHDAREPVQFVFSHSQFKLGVLTDLGSLTPHLVEAYSDCHALLVEANHDLGMLQKGPYPASLKRRVKGAWGHLNNVQTADLVHQINRNKQLKYLIVGHISQQNNLAELAANALEEQARTINHVIYAVQDLPLDWIELN